MALEVRTEAAIYVLQQTKTLLAPFELLLLMILSKEVI